MKEWRKIIRYMLMGVVLMLLAGCGTTSKSTDTPTSGGGGGGGGGGSAQYVGTASLSGSVVVSESDANKVQASAPVNSLSISSYKAKTSSVAYKTLTATVLSSMKPFIYSGLSDPTITDGQARLYALKADGTTEFTNITTNVTSGNYSFSNIKDGTQYIVEVVKVGYDENNNQNILKLKAPAYVPQGPNATANVEVSPKTKYAVDMIIDKVVKKAQSKSVDQATIDLIVQVVAETITDLLTEGKLVLPPCTETYVPPTQSVTVELAEASDKDKSVLETLRNVDKVQNVETQATLKASLGKTVSDMTDDEIKSFLGKIIDGAPDVFMSEFAKSYKAGKTISTNVMVDAFYDTLVPQLKLTGAGANDAAAKVFMKTATVLGIKQALTQLYNFYDANTTNIKVIPSQNIQNIEPLLAAIFPADNRLNINTIDAATLFNVPQGLMIFKMIMPDNNSMGLLGRLYAYFPGLAPNLNNFKMEGPGFDALAFVSALGWMTVDVTKVYVSSIELQVQREMFPLGFFSGTISTANLASSKQEPQEFLNVNVGLMIPHGSSVATSNLTAWLTYTEANNQSQTVQLVENSILGNGSKGGGEVGFSLNAWSIKDYYSRTGNQTYNSRIIRNFKTAAATLEIKSGATVLASQIVEVVKPEIGNVSFVYPKGPNMETVARLGWDNQFTPQELDVDDSNQASPRFVWNAPTGNVPDGYALAYVVELRESVMKNNPSTYAWTPPARFGQWNGNTTRSLTNNDSYGSRTIWSSWDTNRYVYSTEFTAPNPLDVTTKNAALNYQTRYEFVVTPILVKDGSDRQAWQGAQSRTEFFVGNRNWTIQITGQIAFPKRTDIENSDQRFLRNGTWKVALYKMQGTNPGDWMWKDIFGDKSNLNNREPVSAITTLGDMATVANTDINFVSYTLSAIKKSQNPFESNAEYDLVLWYDLTTSNRVDDAIDVTQNLDAYSWQIKFREPQFRFGLHINARDGRLDYWQDGVMMTSINGNKDLLNPDDQEINFDLSSKIMPMGGGYVPPTTPYFPPAAGSGGSTEVKDMVVNAIFTRDGMQNKIIFQTMWDPASNTAPSINFSDFKFVKLVRDWDKKVIATGNPVVMFRTTGLSSELEVSINAMKLTDPSANAIPADSYSLWVYDSATPTDGMKPIYKTSSPWVDSWFINGDTGGMGGVIIPNPGGGTQGPMPVILGSWKKSGPDLLINTYMPINKDVVKVVMTNFNQATVNYWILPQFSMMAGEGGPGSTTLKVGLGSITSGNVPADLISASYYLVGYDQDGGVVFAVKRDGDATVNPYEGDMQSGGQQQQGGGNDYQILGSWMPSTGTVVSINVPGGLPQQITKLALYSGVPVQKLCDWTVMRNQGAAMFTLDTSWQLASGALPTDPNWKTDMVSNYVFKGIAADGTTIVLCAPRSTQNVQQGGGQPSGNTYVPGTFAHGLYSTSAQVGDIMITLPQGYTVSENVMMVRLMDATVPTAAVMLNQWSVYWPAGSSGPLLLMKNSATPTFTADIMNNSNLRFLAFNGSNQPVFAAKLN